MTLPIGRHHFKFIVDGEWITTEDYPIDYNNIGVLENVIQVYPATTE